MLTDHLADIAVYCRVETDDAELPGFVDAAAAYLSGAGVSEPEDGTARFAQYLQCIKYLALDLYDRREPTITGTIVATNPVFRAMLNQLKLTEPVPESGTGEAAEGGA